MICDHRKCYLLLSLLVFNSGVASELQLYKGPGNYVSMDLVCQQGASFSHIFTPSLRSVVYFHFENVTVTSLRAMLQWYHRCCLLIQTSVHSSQESFTVIAISHEIRF